METLVLSADEITPPTKSPRSFGAFERVADGKDEWLTPPHIVRALGEFDLDPCSPINRPWPTAKRHFTIKDDGLSKPWSGRVWLNPPYSTEAVKWMARLANHRNGIALICARTETKMFFDSIWPVADAVFFFRGRLAFYHVTGEQADNAIGAPSCLVAFSGDNVDAIAKSGLDGFMVDLRSQERKRPADLFSGNQKAAWDHHTALQ